MDSNSLQTRQNLQSNKTKNKYKLTLEARHSISIEASNKIRSSLSPRIFVPRLPISCHSSKTKYCHKELTLTNFKSQYSKNFNNSNSNFNKNLENEQKCQNKIADDLLQRLKGKYTNKSETKIMENERENKFKGHKRKRSKLEEKKKLKRRRKMGSKETNLQQNAKTENPKKCDNVKIIDEENPTDNVTYLTDGDIIFIEDIESMTLNDDKLKNAERIHYKEERSSDQNSRESENLRSSEFLQINNENLMLQSNDHNFLKPSNDLPNSTSKFAVSSKNSPVKSWEESGGKLYQILKENPKQSSTEPSSEVVCKTPPNANKFGNNIETKENSDQKNSSGNEITVPNSHNTPQKSEANQNPNATLQKSQTNSSKNLNSNQLKESPLIISRTTENSPQKSPQKSPKSRKHFLSQQELHSLDKHSLQRVPFENLLNTVSSSINDFKDFVKSSISQIYDCSLIDQQINEDLINLETGVETFSKYLLKTHNELDEMDRKTANCLEYLNDRYKSSQKSSSLEPLETDETLTILIEVHKMPIEKITFKKSEILNPKLHQNFGNNQNTSGTIVSQNEQLPNVNANVKQKYFDTTIISNIKLPSIQEMEKQSQKPSEVKPKHIRKKITPRKSKDGSIDKYKNPIIREDDCGQNMDIVTTTTAPQSPLRSHRFKKLSKLKTSGISQQDPVLPTNSYNYSPVTQNHITGNYGPQYPPPISYHYSPQVPNYNTNSNTIYSSPFNPQSQALYYSARSSLQHHGTGLYHNTDYQKYPQNPHRNTYYYSYPMTYNSIFVDYLSNQFEAANEFVNKRSQIFKEYQESHSDRVMQRPND